MISGERIKEAREKKKMTQKQLAFKIGMSEYSVINYETGKRIPKMDVLKKIAEVLGTSVSYLSGDVDSSEPIKGHTNLVMESEDGSNEEVRIAPKYKNLGGGVFSIGDAAFVPRVDEAYSPHCGGAGFNTYVDLNQPVMSYEVVALQSLDAIDPAKPPRAFKTDGHSMVDYGVLPDSWIVVNPADQISAGDICLVTIQDNPVIKKVYPKNGGYILRASSGQEFFADPEEVEIGYVKIVGKVISTQMYLDHRP